MALSPALIVMAMNTNAAAGGTETQAVAHNRLATAIVNTIENATLTYTTGLVAPPGGGPVTGTLAAVIIS